MTDSKTIQILQGYYNIVNQDFNKLNDDERFFYYNVEIDLAKSILQEFGEVTARKVGTILLSICE